jgi:hypothetical protein
LRLAAARILPDTIRDAPPSSPNMVDIRLIALDTLQNLREE